MAMSLKHTTSMRRLARAEGRGGGGGGGSSNSPGSAGSPAHSSSLRPLKWTSVTGGPHSSNALPHIASASNVASLTGKVLPSKQRKSAAATAAAPEVHGSSGGGAGSGASGGGAGDGNLPTLSQLLHGDGESVISDTAVRVSTQQPQGGEGGVGVVVTKGAATNASGASRAVRELMEMGPALVVSSMSSRRGDPRALGQSLEALRRLSLSPSHRDEVAALLPVAHVLELAKLHGSHPRVVCQGLGVLRTLLRGQGTQGAMESYIMRHFTNAVVDEVVDLLDTMGRESSEACGDTACEALRLLRLTCAHPDRAQHLCLPRIVDLILIAARVHMVRASVVSAALGLLRRVSQDPRVQQHLVDTRRALGTIFTALKAHAATAAVQMEGCGVLYNVTVQQQNQDCVVDAGGIQLLVQGVAKTEHHPGVAGEAVGTLANLAWNPEYREHVVAACLNLVMTVAELLAQDTTVTQKAR